MICTRMRLSERRFRFQTSLLNPSLDSATLSATVAVGRSNRPFVRPCTVVNVIGDVNSDEDIENLPLKPINTENGPIQCSIQMNTPRSQHNSCSNRNQITYRAPLMVMTLYLPNLVDTLAKKQVKRDARRPPSFCKKQNSNASIIQCNCKFNTKPDFVVRGKEILNGNCKMEPSFIVDTTDKISDQNEGECRQLCDCLVKLESELARTQPCVDKTELCADFEHYHMDVNGNLPKDSSIPTTRSFKVENNNQWVPCTMISTKSIYNSNTVIRITLNNKPNVANDVIENGQRIVD